MNKYEGKDNYGKPKSDYLERISKMDYESLFKEAEDKIWLSAFAANNPRSDYHWHVDAIYDEFVKRDGNSDGYKRAWEKASRQ